MGKGDRRHANARTTEHKQLSTFLKGLKFYFQLDLQTQVGFLSQAEVR